MKHEDIIDIRDIIERYEELELELLDCFNEQQEIEGDDTQTDDPNNALFKEWLKVTVIDAAQELEELTDTLEKLKGYGGDEQWRGDWYPLILIHEEYFTKYAKELLEDCGDIPRNLPAYIAIDWEQTATNIRVDYAFIDIDGETYFYRG
jgi:hypothetical protein